MKTLLPPGWPRPKGYSNGVSATGRTIFTAGLVGWNEQEFLVSHRLDGQFAQVLRNILAIIVLLSPCLAVASFVSGLAALAQD